MKKVLLSVAFSAALVASANAQIPEDGLVGRYEMDNTSLADSGPNGYDLQEFGAGGIILPADDRFGESLSAIQFINEYANMPDNPNVFDFDATSNMSMAVWMYIESTVIDWTGLLNNWAGFGIGGYYLGITPEQAIRWNVNADPPIDSDPVPTGEWVHVAVTYDGIDAALYINGALAGTETYGVSLLPSAFPFTVASQADFDDNKFPGILDEILVYDRPLTAQEVMDIYENVPLSVTDFNGISRQVQVAPNPVRAQFNISAEASVGALVSYKITDIKGSVIKEATISNMAEAIDVSELAAGAYLLTFKSEYGMEITKRLMKQ